MTGQGGSEVGVAWMHWQEGQIRAVWVYRRANFTAALSHLQTIPISGSDVAVRREELQHCTNCFCSQLHPQSCRVYASCEETLIFPMIKYFASGAGGKGAGKLN